MHRQIEDFGISSENLENRTSEEVATNLRDVVVQACSMAEDGIELLERLRALGCPELRLDTRDVREVGKVANYWRVSRYLPICAGRFRSRFARAEWTPLPRYKPCRRPRSSFSDTCTQRLGSWCTTTS